MQSNLNTLSQFVSDPSSTEEFNTIIKKVKLAEYIAFFSVALTAIVFATGLIIMATIIKSQGEAGGGLLALGIPILIVLSLIPALLGYCFWNSRVNLLKNFLM